MLKKPEDRKLKRAVVKEELVELVRRFCVDVKAKNRKRTSSTAITTALLLNQFLYWEERVADFDAFKEEENRRLQTENEPLIELSKGWIYKSANDLSSETMLDLSDSNTIQHISKLEAIGAISKRHNPNHAWDRTLQYRVNTVRIRQLLYILGYGLEGWPLLPPEKRLTKEELSKILYTDGGQPPEEPDLFDETKNAFSNLENGKTEFATSNLENATKPYKQTTSNLENATSKLENQSSNLENQSSEIENRSSIIENRNTANRTAIPETTTEITTEITISETLSTEGKMMIQAYESQIHPIQNAKEKETLIMLLNKYSAFKVIWAIGEAVSNNNPTLPYIYKILSNTQSAISIEREASNGTARQNGMLSRNHKSNVSGLTNEELWNKLP